MRSEDSFNLWQSILRGAGVITGCRRCADVCPVGADYAAMLRDALDAIPENTPAKEARAAAMDADEKAGRLPDAYAEQRRWIGDVPRAAPDRAEHDAARRSAEDAGRDRSACNPSARSARSRRRAARRSSKASSITSNPDRLDDPDEWRKIPILDKEMLRKLDDREFYANFCVHARRRHRRILALRRLDRHAAVLSAQLRDIAPR